MSGRTSKSTHKNIIDEKNGLWLLGLVKEKRKNLQKLKVGYKCSYIIDLVMSLIL